MFPIRDENPTHHFPLVTVTLIVVNVLAFLYEFSLGGRVEGLIFELGILPVEITTNENLVQSALVPPYATLFTSMFLHGGWMHLIGNMWYLWIFGDNLEDTIGKFKYLFFYLLTGLAAGLTHVLLNPDSTIPTIGASGAISGVLGGYLVLFPRIRVRTIFTLGFFWQIVHLPAVVLLGFWFVFQLIGGAGSGESIAFGAHIGGFVAGALLIRLFTKKAPYRPEHRYDPSRLRRW